MKIIDISTPIFNGMTVYKDKSEKQPRFHREGHGEVTETRLEINVHTGTHIDAPRHMLADGETFESIPIEKLVGPAKVLDMRDVEDAIGKKDLERYEVTEGDFILLKTRNSYEEKFNFEFIYLNEEGARFLAEKGISGVGIDSLGVERSQPEHATHKALFGAGIIIIEGLRLKEASAKTYHMVAAPLKLIGTDGSPARVLLFEEGI